jgi:hypothetical protein
MKQTPYLTPKRAIPDSEEEFLGQGEGASEIDLLHSER